MTTAADGSEIDNERLPWLETVEEEYEERPWAGRFLLFVGLVIAAMAAVGGGWYWLHHSRTAGGNGALIKAPAAPYKIKPTDPGGMQVEGEGDSVFATSQGAQTNAGINVGRLPEAPIDGRKAASPSPAATPAASAKLSLPKAATPTAPGSKTVLRNGTGAPVASAPSGSGAVIQLGAYPSEGAANVAWVRFSRRFAYLAALGKSVEPVARDGKTLYRLRVNAGSNGQARELCGRLKVAGESCFIAN